MVKCTTARAVMNVIEIIIFNITVITVTVKINGINIPVISAGQ